jgi:hypothetical protein
VLGCTKHLSPLLLHAAEATLIHPNVVEGEFSEVRGCRVLGRSGHCPKGKNIRTSEAPPVKSGDRQPEQQSLVVP